MPLTDRKRAAINKALEANFRKPFGEYDSIAVRAIYWKGEEEGYKKESEAVVSFFKDNLRYDNVGLLPIVEGEGDHSQETLRFHLSQLIYEHGGNPNKLLILHYGGHGDPDDDYSGGEEQKSVWSKSGSSNSTTLKWHMLQALLEAQSSDVFLILDCCHADLATRGRRQGMVEILAACSMDEETAGPGRNNSFTAIFLREAKLLLEKTGHIDVRELARVMKQKKEPGIPRLATTPIYTALYGTARGSICLFPPRILPVANATPVVDKVPWRSKITLDLLFTQDSDLLQKDIIVDYLLSRTPDELMAVILKQVVDKSDMVESLDIPSNENSQTYNESLVLNLPDQEIKTILESWTQIQDAVEALAFENWSESSLTRSTNQTLEPLLHLLRVFRSDFEEKFLSAPGLYQSKGVGLISALSDKRVALVGLDSSVKLKAMSLFRIYPGNTAGAPEVENSQLQPVQIETTRSRKHKITSQMAQQTLDDLHVVLVERKLYGPMDIHKHVITRSADCVKQLANILNAPRPEDFYSLKCLCWTHEPGKGFNLAFEVPRGYISTPISLHYVISGDHNFVLPTLNERFSIAIKIGKAMHGWHTKADWVHQSISSHNVIFFRRTDEKNPDYRAPFLCGFEYSRQNGAPSNSVYMDDPGVNIYRHPDRQGAPRANHQKVHDIYSFGVLLLELAIWKVAVVLVDQLEGPLKVNDMLQVLIKTSNAHLGHVMGTEYMKATLLCLSADFGIKEDGAAQQRLARAFRERVIDRLSPKTLIR